MQLYTKTRLVLKLLDWCVVYSIQPWHPMYFASQVGMEVRSVGGEASGVGVPCSVAGAFFKAISAAEIIKKNRPW